MAQRGYGFILFIMRDQTPVPALFVKDLNRCSLNFYRFQFFRAVIGTTKAPPGRTHAAFNNPQMTQRTDGATPPFFSMSLRMATSLAVKPLAFRYGGASQNKLPLFRPTINCVPSCIPNRRNTLPLVKQTRRFSFQN